MPGVHQSPLPPNLGGALQQILQLLQMQRNSRQSDVEVRVHPVHYGKKQVSKTLPQILADLDVSVQDLTAAVDELTLTLQDKRRAERSNRIRATKSG